ncbi:MAG: ABC transporter ATP-binding protein [Burkholderiales bacterium]
MYEVKDLCVAYGSAPALWGVSMTVGQGELVCVVGPNGAGTTTLINAMAGMQPVATGLLMVQGKDVTRHPRHRYCDLGIAVVPEGRRLFTRMSVLENLELGSYRATARAHRKLSLEGVFGLFPVLQERMKSPAGALSGGQQQMLAIGRALMAEPRVLLLDEPSLGLAPAIVLHMFSILKQIHQSGVAVLLVEQNVAMALEIAQRAYVLEEGRIACEGTPAELLAQPHIKRAYLGH